MPQSPTLVVAKRCRVGEPPRKAPSSTGKPSSQAEIGILQPVGELPTKAPSRQQVYQLGNQDLDQGFNSTALVRQVVNQGANLRVHQLVNQAVNQVYKLANQGVNQAVNQVLVSLHQR